MDDKEVGLVWAKNYPRSGEERDALQICRMICRLVRQKTKLVFLSVAPVPYSVFLMAVEFPKRSLTRWKKAPLRRESGSFSRRYPAHSAPSPVEPKPSKPKPVYLLLL